MNINHRASAQPDRSWLRKMSMMRPPAAKQRCCLSRLWSRSGQDLGLLAVELRGRDDARSRKSASLASWSTVLCEPAASWT